MKEKILIFMTALISVVFAAKVTVMAASVKILTANGTCSGILSDANIDTNGNISINASSFSGNCITGSTPPPPGCTPSSATATPNSIIRSITEGSAANSETITIQDNCQNNLTYTASLLAGSNWISLPGSGTGTMTVSFNTASLAAGTYNETIRVTPSGFPSIDVKVSLTVNPNTRIEGVNLPMRTTVSSDYTDSIKNYGTKKYYIIMPFDVRNVVIQTSSLDWSGNVDVFVSSKGYLTCSDLPTSGSYPLYGQPSTGLWYNIRSGSNENVSITGVTFIKDSVLYITVCGRSGGEYKIFWNGW